MNKLTKLPSLDIVAGVDYQPAQAAQPATPESVELVPFPDWAISKLLDFAKTHTASAETVKVNGVNVTVVRLTEAVTLRQDNGVGQLTLTEYGEWVEYNNGGSKGVSSFSSSGSAVNWQYVGSDIYTGPLWGADSNTGVPVDYYVDPASGATQWVMQGDKPPGSGSGSSSGGWGRPNTTTTTQKMYGRVIHHPATPYIPAKPAVPAVPTAILASDNMGWTGGAFSIEKLVGDQYFSCFPKVDMMGCVIGLITEPTTEDYGYVDIEHGFYFALNDYGAQIIEKGISVAGIDPLYWQYWMAAAGYLPFIIKREAGIVSYWLGEFFLYASQTPSEGEKFINAQFYIAGDYVDNPEIGWIGGTTIGNAPFAAFGAFGGESDYCGTRNHPPFAAFSARGSGGTVVFGESHRPFAEFTAFSVESGDYAAGKRPFAAFSARGMADGLKPALVGGKRPFAVFSARGTAIPLLLARSGHNDSPFTAFTAFGSEAADYAGGWKARAIFSAFGRSPQEGIVDFWSFASVLDRFVGVKTGFIVFDSVTRATSIFECDLFLSVEFMSQAEAMSWLEISGNLELAFWSMAEARGLVVSDKRRFKVWTFNLDNGATSTYSNFDFNSFARIGNHDYACREDGVYRIGGDCDHGAPVQARVGFGKQNFRTSKQKHISNVYVGASSTGRMVVKVVEGDSGREFFYAARSAHPNLQQQRIDLGRGLRANWFDFELLNEDGCDFDLESIEFAVVPTTRRI